MLSELVVWLSIWDNINKIGALGDAWSFVCILAPIVTGIGWYYYDKLQNEWFFYFFILTFLVVIVLLIVAYFYIKKRKSYDELYNENKK
jgi:membrane protein YdbS with pleckstrin-like domain